MCPKGRELDEYTPEVAFAKTAPASYEGKIKLKKKYLSAAIQEWYFPQSACFV